MRPDMEGEDMKYLIAAAVVADHGRGLRRQRQCGAGMWPRLAPRSLWRLRSQCRGDATAPVVVAATAGRGAGRLPSWWRRAGASVPMALSGPTAAAVRSDRGATSDGKTRSRGVFCAVCRAVAESGGRNSALPRIDRSRLTSRRRRQYRRRQRRYDGGASPSAACASPSGGGASPNAAGPSHGPSRDDGRARGPSAPLRA